MWRSIWATDTAVTVLVSGPDRRNTDTMQFTTRIKSPQRFLFSSIFAGVWSVASASVMLLRWCLRAPFLSLGFLLRAVGCWVISVWWSAALFLIKHGQARVDHQIGASAGSLEN